jgi:hypothetical protein
MGQINRPVSFPRSAPFPIGGMGKREAGKGISRLHRNNTKRTKREAGEAVVEQGYHLMDCPNFRRHLSAWGTVELYAVIGAG